MTVLPPAPNWFAAQILCSSSKGFIAFGARNSVVILKCKPQTHFTGKNNSEDCETPAESNGKIVYLINVLRI